MGRLARFGHYRRLKMYSQGLSDNELASRENVTLNSIRSWRKRHNLKRNKGCYQTTEKERSIMSSFMSDLITISNRAKTKIDEDAIVRFILAWRLL
jgi:uncharacterized protein YjcR